MEKVLSTCVMVSKHESEDLRRVFGVTCLAAMSRSGDSHGLNSKIDGTGQDRTSATVTKDNKKLFISDYDVVVHLRADTCMKMEGTGESHTGIRADRHTHTQKITHMVTIRSETAQKPNTTPARRSVRREGQRSERESRS